MSRDVKRWWEETAPYFQEEAGLEVDVDWTGTDAHELSLLTDVEEATILELGCGGGQCSIALAERGAEVVGIDLSREQLRHARKLAAERDVTPTFIQADITELGIFPSNYFDIAFNAYVFQWVGDLQACFRDTRRILNDGGRFVFSAPHPVYERADPDTLELTDSYFETGRHVITHEDLESDQVMYRHTIAEYINTLIETGFRLERVHEPGCADPDVYEEGPWGERTPDLLSMLPRVLVIDARAE